MRTHLDSLEVLKDVVYILTNHHRVVSVLRIKVFPLGAFGVHSHLMLDVMKVLLKLLLRNIPYLVLDFFLFLGFLVMLLGWVG